MVEATQPVEVEERLWLWALGLAASLWKYCEGAEPSLWAIAFLGLGKGKGWEYWGVAEKLEAGTQKEIRERIKEKMNRAEEESMGTKEKGQFIRNMT